MSGIKGDFAGLAQIQTQLRGAASGSLHRALVKNVAEEARTQVMNEFREGRDPYGAKWAPSYRATVEGGQTLMNDGRLRASFTQRPYELTSTGFIIGTNVIYAAPHQYGAVIKAKNAPYLHFKVGNVASQIRGKRGKLKRARKLSQWVRVKQVTIPKRQIIPEGDAGPIWERAFQDVADNIVARHLG